jgi:hypothetical protein
MLKEEEQYCVESEIPLVPISTTVTNKKKSSIKTRKRKATERPTIESEQIILDKDTLRRELLYWIEERQSIYTKKEILNINKPWTQDNILLNYRFCNVYRENDRVSKWIFTHWYAPNHDSSQLAFAACVARHFNWPNTLEALEFPSEWQPDKARRILKNRRDVLKLKVYTGAYIGMYHVISYV